MCAEYQISHSHFLGGPPEWTDLDRHKAIWLYVRTRLRCPDCGTRPDEWEEGLGGDQWAYAVDTTRCRGCEVMATFPDAQLEKMGKGVRKYLRKNPPEKLRRWRGADSD